MMNVLALVEAKTHLIIEVELGTPTPSKLAMPVQMTPRIPMGGN